MLTPFAPNPTFTLRITQLLGEQLAQLTAASRALPMAYFSSLHTAQQKCWSQLLQLEQPFTVHLPYPSSPNLKPNEVQTATFAYASIDDQERATTLDELRCGSATVDDKLLDEVVLLRDSGMEKVILIAEYSTVYELRAMIPSAESLRKTKDQLLCKRALSLLGHIETLRVRIVAAGVEYHLKEAVVLCGSESRLAMMEKGISDILDSSDDSDSSLLGIGGFPCGLDVLLERVWASDPTLALMKLLTSCLVTLDGRGSMPYQISMAPRVVGPCEHSEPCFGNIQFFFSCGSIDSDGNWIPPNRLKDAAVGSLEDVTVFTGPLVAPCSRPLVVTNFALADVAESSTQADTCDSTKHVVSHCGDEEEMTKMADSIFAHDLLLRLNRWIDGGCPQRSFLFQDDDQQLCNATTPFATPHSNRMHDSHPSHSPRPHSPAADDPTVLQAPLHVLLVHHGTITFHPDTQRARTFLAKRLRQSIVRLVRLVRGHQGAEQIMSSSETISVTLSVLDNAESLAAHRKIMFRLEQLSSDGHIAVCVIERESSFGGVLLLGSHLSRVGFTHSLELACPAHPGGNLLLLFDLDRTLVDNSPEHRVRRSLPESQIAYLTKEGFRHEHVYVRPNVVPFLNFLAKMQNVAYLTLCLVTKSSMNRAVAATNLLETAIAQLPNAFAGSEKPSLFSTIYSAEDIARSDIFCDDEFSNDSAASVNQRRTSLLLVAKKRSNCVIQKLLRAASKKFELPQSPVFIEPGPVITIDDDPNEWCDSDKSHVVPISPFALTFEGDDPFLFDISGLCSPNTLATQITDRWLRVMLCVPPSPTILPRSSSLELNEEIPRKLAPIIEEDDTEMEWNRVPFNTEGVEDVQIMHQ